VTVPDVAGHRQADAFAVLERAGLRPEAATEPSRVVAEGAVIRTDPVAGTLVDDGSPVTVVVSSGPRPVVVPPVVGLGEAAARKRLTAVGLEATIAGEKDSPQPAGTVLASDPEAGAAVQRGAVVGLTLSCGPNACVD
jgi:serine/threonine-protein kinase